MALPLSKSGKSVRTFTTDETRELAYRMGCDPRAILMKVALGDMPCTVCHATGRSRYRLPKNQRPQCQCLYEDPENPGEYIPDRLCWRCDGKGLADRADRVCVSCHGLKKESVSVADKRGAAKDLMPYCAQQLKQLEINGSIELDASAMIERLTRGRARAAEIVDTTAKPTKSLQ